MQKTMRWRDEVGGDTEPSAEGAMWCVPGARFFMPGGYAICLGVTRDSNLSISSGWASRWLLWSFSTRPPEQEQGQGQWLQQEQAQLWPFCICFVHAAAVGAWKSSERTIPHPLHSYYPQPQLQLMASSSRLQPEDYSISCPLESSQPARFLPTCTLLSPFQISI